MRAVEHSAAVMVLTAATAGAAVGACEVGTAGAARNRSPRRTTPAISRRISPFPVDVRLEAAVTDTNYPTGTAARNPALKAAAEDLSLTAIVAAINAITVLP